MNSLESLPGKKILLLISLMIMLSLALLVCRITWTGNLNYAFLALNLFLAFIPLCLSYIVFLFHFYNPNERIILFLLMLTWLLFFPNAPYIITDFIHLNKKTEVPVWFDGMMIFSFALTGLISALFSLNFIHQVLIKLFRSGTVFILLGLISGISGYGIYLGRFLRWHSKDIFFHPIMVIRDCLYHLQNPVAIAMTTCFFLLITTSYIVFNNLMHPDHDQHSKMH